MRMLVIVGYYLIGIALVGAGLLHVFMPSAILGSDATGLVRHISRELSTGQVFAGMLVLWAARNFDKRRPVHVALVVMTGLLAFIHWNDYIDHPGTVRYAIVNTVPFVLLLVTTPFSARGGPGAH